MANRLIGFKRTSYTIPLEIPEDSYLHEIYLLPRFPPEETRDTYFRPDPRTRPSRDFQPHSSQTPRRLIVRLPLPKATSPAQAPRRLIVRLPLPKATSSSHTPRRLIVRLPLPESRRRLIARRYPPTLIVRLPLPKAASASEISRLNCLYRKRLDPLSLPVVSSA